MHHLQQQRTSTPEESANSTPYQRSAAFAVLTEHPSEEGVRRYAMGWETPRYNVYPCDPDWGSSVAAACIP